jgi:hypothetical protein
LTRMVKGKGFDLAGPGSFGNRRSEGLHTQLEIRSRSRWWELAERNGGQGRD